MKEKRSFLFVGGPADGRRETLPVDALYHKVHVKESPFGTGSLDKGAPAGLQVTYRQEKFAFGGSNKSILFMAYEGLSIEEAVSKLFVNYRP